MEIRKAVFPIAGLGTRFLPITKACPKEMLAIVDKPLIQYAVEEAYSAGIRQMIFITGRTKRSVEDYFDMAYELELELEITQKAKLLSLVQSIKPKDMECFYIRQPKALGLGHAVLCAETIVANEPFAIILADDLMVSTPSVLKQMVNQFLSHQASIVAVEEVPRSKTSSYGIVSCEDYDQSMFLMKDIIEKPMPEYSPSTIAVAGRYILMPTIFEELKKLNAGVSGEIQLTDAIASLLKREKVFAYKFHGQRYDCGNKLGFLQAIVDLAKTHADVGLEFSTWLESTNS